MSNRYLLVALCISLLTFSAVECWGRGGGGGGRGGGGGGGARGGGGGGFSGGASLGGGGGARPSPGPSGGNFGGARPAPGNMGGAGGARPATGNVGGARPNPGNIAGGAGSQRPGAGSPAGAVGGINRTGAGQAAPGQRPATGAVGAGNRGVAGQGAAGQGAAGAAANRFNAPSQNQLSGFLGLPSDEGLSHAGARPGATNQAGGNFDVNYGAKEGARGGQAAGVTVTGPGGNTVGRAAAEGARGGAAVVGGVQGAAGGTAARGAAVGPGGQAVAGRGAVGPAGNGRAGVVTAGPAGVGAGFTRVTPSGRYTTAAAVRGNYNNWGVYGQGWHAQYPGAWVATGMAANALWNASTWNAASSYCGYSEQPPVYYDYGNSVVYEDDSVYVNGDNAGTADEYYSQAADLATTGAQAEAPADGDWLPLGVFALTKQDATNSDVTIQLAINKQGILRGNYTDTATKMNQVVQGSVDKQTQRVAFTVGDNTENVVETGLYNLTKDEAPALIHFGKDRTEQWLLVRLQQPDAKTN